MKTGGDGSLSRGQSTEAGASRRTQTDTRLSRRIPFARQVADRLRDRIIRGELPPGGRIVERSLCEAMAVSRTPLREALKLLEAEGLVEISQNKGARIMSFTPAEASNLFEVIAGLESLAAELAVMRMTPADLAELDDLHARMLDHYQRQEKDPYFALNSAIHDTVVRLSANPILISTHAGLMLRARRGRYMAIVAPDRWAESVGEHEALMSALHARDGVAAGRVWRRHLIRTGETVCAVLAAVVQDEAADAADASDGEDAFSAD
ncbi:GntR family transcriptional regulator [Aquabacter sp. L1I39]|uniref:GntR family transcriptional regulator n=1 Tax=Aquabacter sp. L1I39 TaxID=2820278 RepID=UPI001ADAC9A4|nr:GntR family transcriptional regulator [Aquabacter sp. L1I39]QTL02101.1 GntR family transcriptional regulator [Aquabacter sp. L1I39]